MKLRVIKHSITKDTFCNIYYEIHTFFKMLYAKLLLVSCTQYAVVTE